MESINKLTYEELEPIMIVLKGRADSEEAYGNGLWHRGDEEASAPIMRRQTNAVCIRRKVDEK